MPFPRQPRSRPRRLFPSRVRRLKLLLGFFSSGYSPSLPHFPGNEHARLSAGPVGMASMLIEIAPGVLINSGG